jgi:2'-5' RNA ligase
MNQIVKRIFVGIPLILDENTLEHIERIKLETAHFKAKWVAQANYHLTISFIGETPINEVNKIAELLQTSHLHIAEFDLIISGLGIFPNIRNTKVLWLGISASETLAELATNIHKVLAISGNIPFPPDFKAHLTIARFYSPPDSLSLKKTLDYHKNEVFGQVHINHFCLFESILQNISVSYAVINKYILNQH